MDEISENSKFTCDFTKKSSPLDHHWEHTVGSGHATLALRADWQKQLARCRRELGFKHVRFHGILSDNVGTLVCEDNKPVHSFYNADHICDFLLSIGMRPFMELSFMPLMLSSGDTTVFSYKDNVTPPKDNSRWGKFIADLIKHWSERYGAEEVSKWFFEVWNEPNLKAFWTGSQLDYFNFYKATAVAIKGVNKAFKVGGPATAENAWVAGFFEFCQAQSVPVDFISTHHYPTDAFGKPGDDTVTQLSKSKRSILREQAAATKANAHGLPVYYTEWSTSSNPFDTLHDQPYAAAFIVKTVMESRDLVEGYSYWAFSDIFDENYFSSKPFHGGFGLMTIHGIPKPAYRAYELMHQTGDEAFESSGSNPTVDAWFSRRGKSVFVLLSNSALPLHPCKTEMIQLDLKLGAKAVTAFIERVDDTHSNANSAWLQMGSPESLSAQQISALELASSLIKAPVALKHDGQVTSASISIPPQGVVLLTIECE